VCVCVELVEENNFTYSIFNGSIMSSAVCVEQSIIAATCSQLQLTSDLPSHSSILSPGLRPIFSAGPP